jgi:hypothetical protein
MTRISRYNFKYNRRIGVGLRKTTRNLNRDMRCPVEVRTGHLPKLYCLMNLPPWHRVWRYYLYGYVMPRLGNFMEEISGLGRFGPSAECSLDGVTICFTNGWRCALNNNVLDAERLTQFGQQLQDPTLFSPWASKWPSGQKSTATIDRCIGSAGGDKSKSKPHCDWRSVSMSWCRAQKFLSCPSGAPSLTRGRICHLSGS